MCATSILFSFSDSTVDWTDSFSNIKTDELKQLIVQCRYALHSLQGELADRENPQADERFQSCCENLEKDAAKINTSGMGSKEIRLLEDGCLLLEALGSDGIRSSQTRESRKEESIYKQILWLISARTGPASALLLACSLGKHRVQRLNLCQSARLIKYMAQNRTSLFCSTLHNKAVEAGLYHESMDLLLIFPGFAD
jgi:hypothetical protein